MTILPKFHRKNSSIEFVFIGSTPSWIWIGNAKSSKLECIEFRSLRAIDCDCKLRWIESYFLVLRWDLNTRQFFLWNMPSFRVQSWERISSRFNADGYRLGVPEQATPSPEELIKTKDGILRPVDLFDIRVFFLFCQSSSMFSRCWMRSHTELPRWNLMKSQTELKRNWRIFFPNIPLVGSIGPKLKIIVKNTNHHFVSDPKKASIKIKLPLSNMSLGDLFIPHLEYERHLRSLTHNSTRPFNRAQIHNYRRSFELVENSFCARNDPWTEKSKAGFIETFCSTVFLCFVFLVKKNQTNSFRIHPILLLRKSRIGILFRGRIETGNACFSFLPTVSTTLWNGKTDGARPPRATFPFLFVLFYCRSMCACVCVFLKRSNNNINGRCGPEIFQALLKMRHVAYGGAPRLLIPVPLRAWINPVQTHHRVFAASCTTR